MQNKPLTKIIMPSPKRRSSCNVCNRQAKHETGLKDFTCYQCGWSYNSKGQADHTHFISKKKLHDEFEHAKIKLSDGEVDKIFAQCHFMANRIDVKVRVTFQSCVAGLIGEFQKRGWTKDKRNKSIGILNQHGKTISRST